MKTLAFTALTALVLAQATCAAPTPAVPTRILITLQAVQVGGDTAYSVTPGPEPAAGVFQDVLKGGKAEVTEVALLTPANSPGTAESSQLVLFTVQDHGKPSLGITRVPTTLEALPRLNADGTVTVGLKISVTRRIPGATNEVPVTTSQRLETVRTFKDGGTLLFGGATYPSMKNLLMFVTVKVLPAENAAHSPRTMP